MDKQLIRSMLKGVTVVDFTALLPGPYATKVLAEMGATVIRIESPKRGDMVNALPPIADDGESYAYKYLNGAKQIEKLDLKKQQDLDRAKSLIAEADVLVEGFRPGVMAKLGLDYQTCQQLNEKLIFASITGYGQEGPYAKRAGHDNNYLSISGMASYSGTEETGPTLSGFQIADLAGGSQQALVYILGALFQRGSTGKGQFLDISMAFGSYQLNNMNIAMTEAGAPAPDLGRTMLNGGHFYGFYQTRDGRYMSVGSLEPQFAQALSQALGLEELFPIMISLMPQDQEKVRAAIKEKFLQNDFSHWCELFSKYDCCVEPVLNLSEAMDHPQIRFYKERLE